MLFTIKGKKGAGKDSLAGYLLPLGFEQHRFADPLKAMLATFFQMQGIPTLTIYRMLEGDLKEKPCEVLMGKTPRHAMQTLGTEWRDTIHKDLWVNALVKRMGDHSNGSFIISDVRFAHEAEWVRGQGGHIVEVVRNDAGRTEEGSQHASELEMEAITPDITVYNYGSFDDLAAVTKFVAEAVRNVDIASDS